MNGDERRRLEAVRLIALARDLLTDERERTIAAELDRVLKKFDRLCEVLAIQTRMARSDD